MVGNHFLNPGFKWDGDLPQMSPGSQLVLKPLFTCKPKSIKISEVYNSFPWLCVHDASLIHRPTGYVLYNIYIYVCMYLYIYIPAPSKGLCLNPKGLFSGTLCHLFGTPWRVQVYVCLISHSWAFCGRGFLSAFWGRGKFVGCTLGSKGWVLSWPLPLWFEVFL